MSPLKLRLRRYRAGLQRDSCGCIGNSYSSKMSFAKRAHRNMFRGETFCYLGRRYRLKIVDLQDEPLKFDGTRFTLRRDARPAEEHFRSWYITTGSDWLKRRVQFVSRRTSTRPLDVRVRELGFRWGSCGKNGVIFSIGNCCNSQCGLQIMSLPALML